MPQDNSIPLQAFNGERPIDNYLKGLYQDQQAKRAEQQGAMQAQKFDQQSQISNLAIAKQKHENLVNILGRSTDEASFQQGLQQAALPVEQGGLGLPPEQLSHLSFAKDYGRLKQEAGVVGEDLAIQLQKAQIGSANASTRHSLAATQALTTQAASGGDAEFDPQDPFAGLSPKARERLIIQNSKEYATTAKENDKEAQSARAAIIDANRFAQLSKQVNAPGDWSTGTGALAGLPGVRQLQGALDSRFGEMDAITARLVPKLREPGSGATSDFDAQMFQKGTIGVDKQGKTNDAIVTGIQAAARNMIEKARFEEAFFKARKTLVGSQDAWQSYLEANPIFDPSSVDMPKVNKARVSWRQYFSQPQQQTAAPAPAATTSPAPQGGAPAVGTIEDGHRFKGGDPSNPANWEKVG